MSDFIIGALAGFALLATAGLIGLVNWLGNRNIFFTFVREGTAKNIVRFGQYRKTVMAYKDHSLDAGGEVVHSPGSGRRRFGGLAWLGIPFVDAIDTYPFTWVSIEQKEKDGKAVQVAVPHTATLDYIPLKTDNYFARLDADETKDKIPCDVDVLLRARIVNPYKARFRVENWLVETINETKGKLRDYVAERTYSKLQASKNEEFDALIRLNARLKDDYGIQVDGAEILNIDPPANYQAASTKQWEARQEAKAILIHAKAEEDRIRRVYGPVAQNREWLRIRELEALERSPVKWIQDIVAAFRGTKS